MGLRSLLGLTSTLEPSRSSELAYAPAHHPRIEVGTWDPVSNLEAIVWADLFGTDIHPVTRAEAMAVPAVARARHVLATIARVPLRDVDTDTGTPTDPAPSWIARTDTPVSAFHRMLGTIDDHLFYGESLWLVDRGSDGWPLVAEHVPYSLWDVDPDSGAIRLAGDPAPARSVVHLPGPHEGLLAFGSRTIRQGTALDKAAAETARMPFRVELHNTTDIDLDDAEIDAVVSRARAALAENGGILYTSRGVEAKVHTTATEHLLIEGRNAVALDVARLVGLPASVLDAAGPSSMTYTNSQAKLAEAVDFGLGLYMAAISARLSLEDVTPRGRRVTFDLEALVTPALASAGMTEGTPP